MCTVWAALFLFLSPFPFRYRFAALRSARLRRSLNLSLSFIHLSLSSSLNHVPFFFPPSPPPTSTPRPRPPPCPHRARVVTLVFPETLRLRLSFSRPPRPFSLVISSSFALSIFLPLLSPPPPPSSPSIFPLSYASLYCLLLPFVYYHQLLSFNPFLPRRAFYLSFSLSSLSFPLTLSLHVPPPPFS